MDGYLENSVTLKAWQHVGALYNEATRLTNALEAKLDSFECARDVKHSRRVSSVLDKAWQRQQRRRELQRIAEENHFGPL
jgi:hypothetical protein